MKAFTYTLIATLAVALLAPSFAAADWFPGDGNKMHFPQLPDPNGWDIEIFTSQHEVADDWQCTQTGPVSDIHFWYSVAQDGGTQIGSVTATIYKDVPADTGPVPLPYSTPGDQVWSRTFDASQFTVIDPYGTGAQGFADPQQGLPAGWGQNDHQTFQQLNIVDIVDPFIQQEGTIYWLGLYVDWLGIQSPVGWKTSQDHFMDDAVFLNNGRWEELIDPFTGQSLDMAFVITPEPATLTLLALGAVAVLRRR
jgi:PEP-CTERM motif